MSSKRIVVAGYGYWGPNLVRNLSRVIPPERIAICDVSNQALSRAKKEYPHLDAFDDIESAIKSPEVEGVVLAIPVEQHAPMARLALENGKHVLVEKPLASTIEDSEMLVRLAEKSGKVLMVGHTFLYSPPVRKVKDLIEDSHLGEIRYITSSRINLGIHRKDVSVVWDLASHDIAIICYWLGEFPQSVSTFATCTAGQFPDVAFINLKFGSGVIANVQVSWIAPTKIRRTTLVGSEKMVLYEDTNQEEPVKVFDKGVKVIEPADFGEYQLTYRTGDVWSPRVTTKEPLQEELEHFLDCIKTGVKPLSDGVFGKSVVGVLQAAEASWLNEGRVEKVVLA